MPAGGLRTGRAHRAAAGGVRFAISAAGGPEILKEDQRSAWFGGLMRTSGEIVDYVIPPARSA